MSSAQDWELSLSVLTSEVSVYKFETVNPSSHTNCVFAPGPRPTLAMCCLSNKHISLQLTPSHQMYQTVLAHLSSNYERAIVLGQYSLHLHT